MRSKLLRSPRRGDDPAPLAAWYEGSLKAPCESPMEFWRLVRASVPRKAGEMALGAAVLCTTRIFVFNQPVRIVRLKAVVMPAKCGWYSVECVLGKKSFSGRWGLVAQIR